MLALAGYFGYKEYKAGYLPNVEVTDAQNGIVKVYVNTSLKAFLDTLDSYAYLKSREDFEKWAKRKGVEGDLKPGRYKLKNNMTNNKLLNMLVAGNQAPLNVTLHDISDIYELSGRLSKYLMTDSITFLGFFNSSENLKAYDLNPQTVTSVFIPNTYEFYWTTAPNKVLERMLKEYETYWTEERKDKAAEEGLSPLEVITLASIVEKETIKSDEKPLVARLYLNRLKQNIKMESDPTVIYGINLDFPKRRITRVYYKDLEYESPYNTYQNLGLPPGPIKIPAQSSIEAVLNAPQHDFIFMVADPQRLGYHSFAKNYRQHLVNVAKFRTSQ